MLEGTTKKLMACALVATAGIGSACAPSSARREHVLAGAPLPAWRPALLVREQPPANGDRSRPVLYLHGATFPSASSMMYKLEGVSWADQLNAAGFDVFALDYAGYGGSERYPAMVEGQVTGAPLGRAPEAAFQVERAVRLILHETGAKRVSIIAHSWGTLLDRPALACP